MGILGWHPAAGRESEFWLDLAKGGWMDGGHPLNWIHKLQHFHLMVSGRDWSHIQHSHNLMGRISRIFDTRLFQQFRLLRLWDFRFLSILTWDFHWVIFEWSGAPEVKNNGVWGGHGHVHQFQKPDKLKHLFCWKWKLKVTGSLWSRINLRSSWAIRIFRTSK